MPTDLARFVETATLHDTHEHMWKEEKWLETKPDVLCEIFSNYIRADFVVAGAAEAAVNRLYDAADPDVAGRFEGVREAWEAIQFTGYAEASRMAARRFFGIEHICAKALAAAQEKLPAAWPAGDRLRVLRDEGRFDHIQVDDFSWPCLPDKSGPAFFFYDLSWANFCRGVLHPRLSEKTGARGAAEELHAETGVTVRDLATLREAMARIFEKYAPCAVAVKAQHAYNRTLRWKERSDEEATDALSLALAKPDGRSDEEMIALGDWCWARGVELAIEHNLPFKIHTGYYAGHSKMPVDRIAAGHLCPLLARYPKCRFVLMHIAYPYENELVALAKHYPNVFVDLCWAWSINPRASEEFVRRFLHAAPANKLLGFGGDTSRARAAVAFADQARRGMARALQAEVDDGTLSEAQAIEVARRWLSDNQKACFDLDGLRRRIGERAEAGA